MRESVSNFIRNVSPSVAEYEEWMIAAIPKEECSLLGQGLWLAMLLNCVPNNKVAGY